jgi:hypothetical protein
VRRTMCWWAGSGERLSARAVLMRISLGRGMGRRGGLVWLTLPFIVVDGPRVRIGFLFREWVTGA